METYIGVENRGQNYTRYSRNLCAKFGCNRQSGFQVQYSAHTDNAHAYCIRIQHYRMRIQADD